MALYVIGDTHLSLSANKSMEAFGEGWTDYVQRLREGFAALGEQDLCVLCGDLSWGMSLEEAAEDFRFLASFPGKKLIVKGNHDYWWSTAAKAKRFFAEHGLEAACRKSEAVCKAVNTYDGKLTCKNVADAFEGYQAVDIHDLIV